MSKSSIRNKAKSITSPLFTTMGHFHSEHHKVIFMCTTQERKRTEKGLMASEMNEEKHSQAPQSASRKGAPAMLHLR